MRIHFRKLFLLCSVSLFRKFFAEFVDGIDFGAVDRFQISDTGNVIFFGKAVGGVGGHDNVITEAISVGGSSTTGINGNIISKENCKYFSVDGVQKSSDTKGLRIEKRDNGYVKTINK